MPQRRPNSTTSLAKRIKQLAAAIEAYRAGHPRRRLPRGLRAQVVAVIEAGASAKAVREACNVSAWQITRWRKAAAPSAEAAASESPRVLSVVDSGPRANALDSEIELRIGGWHVSLRRAE